MVCFLAFKIDSSCHFHIFVKYGQEERRKKTNTDEYQTQTRFLRVQLGIKNV